MTHNPGIPHGIIFFPNGLAAVFDGFGRQLPKYQEGSHATTIKLLAADGYDWRELPDRTGVPQEGEPMYFTDRDRWIREQEAKLREGTNDGS
jgi:hypothetical protein